jgi:hypothetical protein
MTAIRPLAGRVAAPDTERSESAAKLPNRRRKDSRAVPTLLPTPTQVTAAGTPPKRIDEYVGLASGGTDAVSIAVMQSPPGWSEPAQSPDFDEWTLVLHGRLVVEHEGGVLEVLPGQAVHVAARERVRYATPSEPTKYVSVCLPAFSPGRVHRDVPGNA